MLTPTTKRTASMKTRTKANKITMTPKTTRKMWNMTRMMPRTKTTTASMMIPTTPKRMKMGNMTIPGTKRKKMTATMMNPEMRIHMRMRVKMTAVMTRATKTTNNA